MLDANPPPRKTRLMTGARPTGGLHIGQYFAAFRPFVDSELPKEESVFIVSDLHMLTTKFTKESTRGLRDAVLGLVAEAIAFGVNPEKTVFYLQSQVPWQARIYAILQSLAPIDNLTAQISFRDMARHTGGREPSLGLLGYPVLESSDVISVQATHVTVGEYNIGHFKLMQAILAELNEDYGFPFSVPEVITGRRNLVGLDGSGKMSKSAGNAIFFRDDDDTIKEKVQAMRPLGPQGEVVPAEYLEVLGAPREDREEIAAAVNADPGRVPDAVVREIVDRCIAFVAPIRSRAAELDRNPDYIGSLLGRGCRVADALGAESYDLLVKAIRLPRFQVG